MRYCNTYKLFLLVCAGLYCFSVHAQSLVLNPSFERHSYSPSNPQYHAPPVDLVDDWSGTGLGGGCYCNEDVVRTKQGQDHHPCCIDDILPHSGKGMMRLSYIEGCPEEITACATYIYTRLQKPMEVGKVYAVSMWLYYPEYPSDDTTIFENIGFYLSLQSQNVGHHDLAETDYFFGDKIIRNNWIEIKRYIRALCPLRYVTIGVFKNKNFPQLHRRIDHTSIYYVDDVKVYEVEEDTLSKSITPTPYCEYYKKRIENAKVTEPHQLQIYFSSNSSALELTEQVKLDSFYSRMKANEGYAYIAEGHTDNQGTENKVLSFNRAKSVEQYYKSNYDISTYKFITYGMGSSDPIDDNNTKVGRKLNRRVTIHSSDITTLEVVYRKGLRYLKEERIKQAVESFKIWIATAPDKDKMAVLHDPRLNKLKSHSTSWASLQNDVRRHYNHFILSEEAFFLDSMYFVDQRYRTFTPISYSGYVSDHDTAFFEELHISLSNLALKDSFNTEIIKKFLTENPFPKISEVGRRQVRAVCYVLIHSLDSTVIFKYLPILQDNCLKGEAEWEMYATMYDRYCFLTGSPQHYGTQSLFIDAEKTELQLYKFDNLNNVNERRKKIGLWPLGNPGKKIN